MPPSFTRKLKETYGQLGSSAVLECKVYGSPPILVSWFHDGQEITSGDKYQATLTDNTCSLKVNGLQESDMGTYSCTATNVAGSDECSAFLSVRGQYLSDDTNLFTKRLNSFVTHSSSEDQMYYYLVCFICILRTTIFCEET